MDSDQRESDALPPDVVLKTRMALHALYNPEGFDLRTAIVLSDNGLIPDNLATFAPEPYILAAIKDPSSANRVMETAGPLVMVKSPAGGTNVSVVTAAELLLTEVLEARNAAVEHLQTLAASKLSILTDRTREALAKNKDNLLSDATWRRAAVNVLDALDDDFLYNLAGLRQCVAIDYREGVSTYMPLVLRPSLTVVNAIPFGVGVPSQEREALLGLIEESVRSAASVGDLCEDYHAKLGHLPLTGEVSLGAAVRKWLAGHETSESLWSAVWTWTDMARGPLPRYHACQVFIENPAFVPEGEEAKLWGEILEVVTRPDKDEEGLKWNLPWRLRGELLHHFAAHFECLAPGEDGERITVAALWVTERVASALSPSSVDIGRLLDQIVEPTEEQSRGIWQIARPPIQPSSLRYAALLGPSLFSLSMLGELGERIREFATACDEKAEDRVKDTLMAWLMQFFPTLPLPETPTYAFDRGVLESAESWVEPCEGDEESLVGSIRALVECQKALQDGGRLESEIRRLPGVNEASQSILTLAMRSMAYTAKLPIELMRECLWNEQWHYSVLESLSSGALATFWDGIVELQLQQGGDWRSQLPHLWVRMCEAFDEHDGRYAEVIDQIILGSVNTGAVSALKHLIATSNRKIIEKVADWKQRIEAALQLGTPWTQAKLREFLSVLDQPSLVAAGSEKGEHASRTDDPAV